MTTRPRPVSDEPQRSRSFGAAAAAYERYRPEYPEAMVELIRDYASRPIRSALEIGAGTGKATRVLVRQGISVTASESDAAMLAELRTQVLAARTVRATLEELPDLGRFDLVLAAASLHWTDRDGRWDRISALLEPEGIFACVGGAPELADPELVGAVARAQRAWLVDDQPAGPVEMSESGMHWPATELLDDERFTDVREETVAQPLVLPAADWIGYLSTVSAYLVLSPQDREAALAAVAALLPDPVDVRADLTVQLARRTR